MIRPESPLHSGIDVKDPCGNAHLGYQALVGSEDVQAEVAQFLGVLGNVRLQLHEIGDLRRNGAQAFR